MLRPSFESNKELVDYLAEKNKIKSDKVEKAFKNTDRSIFVERGDPYEDSAQPIGHSVTISAPHMVAINTELLNIQEKDEVLEIGSGSGYQLAIIAEIAKKAVGVERIEELVEKSKKRLEDKENIEIIHGDGLKAIEDKYDKILYSCGIEEKELEKAKKHLKEDGIIVAPLKRENYQEIIRFRNGKQEKHGKVRFVEKEKGTT